MTVPAIPVFDDWKFDLLNLTTGAVLACNLNADIIDIKGTNLPGVTGDRLESVDMTVRARASDGTPTATASVLFANSLLMFRAVPYGTATLAVYGLVVKPDAGYDQRGQYDAIQVHVVGIEYLLHSRLLYHYDAGAATFISIAAGKADDFAKKLVRYSALPGTCAADPDGNSRDWAWGTLAVQADAAECTDDVTLSVREDYLDEVLVSLSEKYLFDWELRPSVAGGVVTFTFSTKLHNSVDRSYGNTDGNRPVIVADRGGLIPSGKRWWTLDGVITALHTADLKHAELNAGTLALVGRWEGRAQGNVVADLEIGLEESDLQEGYEGEFDAATVNGSCSWGEDFNTGDKVTRVNNRLDIAATSDRIAAVSWSFPQKRLKLEIRWGDREPGLNKKTRGGPYRRPLQTPPDDGSSGYWDRNGTTAVIFPGNNALLTDAVLINQNTIPVGAIADTKLDVNAPVRITRYLYSTTNSLSIFGADPGGTYLAVHIGDDGASGLPARLDVVDGGNAIRHRLNSSSAGGQYSFLSGVTYFADYTAPTALNFVKIDPADATPSFELWRGTDLEVYSDAGTTRKVQIDGATGNSAWWGGADLQVYSDGGVTEVFQVDGGTGNTTILGYAHITGVVYTRNDLLMRNKADGGWLTWADRNTGGAEAVYDLSSIGTIVTSGTVTVGSGVLLLYDANSYLWRETTQDRLDIRTDRAALYFEPAAATHYVANATTFRPATTGTETLGNTSFRFGEVWSVLGNFSGQITSTLAIGTAPLAVTSTTVCTNLNAGYVGGKAETAFVLVDGSRAMTADWDAGNFGIRAATFQSDVATGTQPFVVASTTMCTNLNASYVGGFQAAQAATDGYIVVREADGDIAMKALATVDGVDISLHVHSYDKPTQTGTWTVFGATDWNSTPVQKLAAGTDIWFWASDSSGGGSPYWARGATGATPHRHANGAGDYAWSFAATNTGTP